MIPIHECVGGDGGPLIVLQSEVLSHWQGAADFDNSLMGGGDVETDYDVICESVDASEFCVITRYDRDMLILWDSSWAARVRSLSDNSIAIIQCCDPEDDVNGIVNSVLQRVPERSLPLRVKDTTLRLQVGADGGDPAAYDYRYLDLPITPGEKQCTLYRWPPEAIAYEQRWVVIIRDMPHA